MAQFFRDFTADTAGTIPSDFTQDGATGIWSVVDNGTEQKFLRASGGSDNTDHWLLWDGTGSPGSVQDVQILTKYRVPSGSPNFFPAAGRYSASGNQTVVGRHDARSDKSVARANAFSELANGGLSPYLPTDGTWYFCRLQLVGSDLKARFWPESASEPTVWDLEVSGGVTVAAGSAGIHRYGLTTYEWQFISVGTNGDPAPTEAPSTGDNLSANDISSTSQVSSPAIAQTHALTANDVSSLSSVTAPELGQTHSLSATDVQSSSEVTNPAIAVQANTDNLTADDISSTSTTSSTAIGQVHNLAANDATSTSETGAPALQQTHALTSVDVSSLSTVSSPALTSVAGQDSLAANDVQATSTVTSPTLGQVHNLTADDLNANSETDSPNLGQVHALTANDLASTSEISSPTIRNASQVLATPIKNTRATVSQKTYKAAIIQPVYKAESG